MTQYFENALSHKPYQNYGPKLIKALIRFAKEGQGQASTLKSIGLMAGLIVETALLFDKSDEACAHLLEKIAQNLDAQPSLETLESHALPPAYLNDQMVEKGRAIVTDILIDWELCNFEFQDFIAGCITHTLAHWNANLLTKEESLRFLSELTYRGMAYELSAQELCDMLIETKARTLTWDLSTCISALAAVAGHKHAAHSKPTEENGQLYAHDDLDQIIHCMTQEAIRHGVPAGSDWRFGLAANDIPVSAPYNLIQALEPLCDGFFNAIQMIGPQDQAIACAKASGRLLAIIAGGEIPEIEPIIAKPLAVAAMSDTYKTVYSENFYRA